MVDHSHAQHGVARPTVARTVAEAVASAPTRLTLILLSGRLRPGVVNASVLVKTSQIFEAGRLPQPGLTCWYMNPRCCRNTSLWLDQSRQRSMCPA